MNAPFQVQVCCALRDRQEIASVRVVPGETVADALGRCDILTRFPEYDSRRLSVAIHGVTADGGTLLRPGDRVDLLRALTVDPKEARRRRARKMRGGVDPGTAALREGRDQAGRG